MITFKQFITEIDHDDTVFSKRASQAKTDFPIDNTWEPLTEIEGHSVVWRQVVKEYRVAMLDKKTQPMFLLELMVKKVKVSGGTLTGVVTSTLSSKEEYRGKGYAIKIYEALTQHGQVLFSSNSQTTGSRLLWEKLVKNNLSHAFVLASDAAAKWYTRKFAEDKIRLPNVLLTGTFDRMNDAAYESAETRWLILPSNIAGLNKLREGAIELT